MPLQLGQWNVNGNGFTGVLNLLGVDGSGNINGTVFGDPVAGFWDEVSQTITFLRISNPADPSTMQVYTGHMFSNGAQRTLAGAFEAFQGTGAVARRVKYGWFAQIST